MVSVFLEHREEAHARRAAVLALRSMEQGASRSVQRQQGVPQVCRAGQAAVSEAQVESSWSNRAVSRSGGADQPQAVLGMWLGVDQPQAVLGMWLGVDQAC